MDSIPACFIRKNRWDRKPFRKNSKTNDIMIGNKVYEVPEYYWCSRCGGEGCKHCKGTGIQRKVDREYLNKR
jgi:predicted methyltransferase